MPRRAEKVPSQADGNKRTNKQTNKLGKEHKSRENLVNNEKNGSGPLLIWPETPPMKSFPPQFNPSRLGHWIIWILRPTLIDLFTSFALVQIKFDASFKIVVGHIKGIFELFKGNLIMLKAW